MLRTCRRGPSSLSSPRWFGRRRSVLLSGPERRFGAHQFFAGVLFAWVLSYIGIGMSFCVTYLIHRREPEHLVFGLNSLAMAIHSVELMLATPMRAKPTRALPLR